MSAEEQVDYRALWQERGDELARTLNEVTHLRAQLQSLQEECSAAVAQAEVDRTEKEQLRQRADEAEAGAAAMRRAIERDHERACAKRNAGIGCLWCEVLVSDAGASTLAELQRLRDRVAELEQAAAVNQRWSKR